jgi:hypothetical protein
MSPQSRNAYMAGILEGEGCFAIGRSFNNRADGTTDLSCYRYQAKICITNTNEKLFKWVVKHFGGSYRFRQNGGNIENSGRIGEWAFTGGNKAMEKFLLSLLPYFVMKDDQAKILLKFVRLHLQKAPEERERLYQELKSLHC